MAPVISQRFGPYEILGILGGGGMGLIFRAWDERLHREVAVKMLHDTYSMPGLRERFLQEARAASALNHPNICTIFDIGEQDGEPYLVMELLKGETLKERISRGALTATEIVRHAGEIADGLAAAHAKGIVHRDIKPANIFLVAMPDGKSQAKVLDFGLAQIGLEVRGGSQSRALDLTLEGATVGTLAYMSPEQARGESLDARSDLFSLGVVMYEMATRQVPFRGTTSEQMFVELFDRNPEPVRIWNESIPREMETVVLKLLEKDRKRRFETAKELRDAINRITPKLSKRRWSTREVSAVPLVKALDPVARHKRSSRRPSEVPGESAGGLLIAAESPVGGSSSKNLAIRPVCMPAEERDGAVFQHSVHGRAQAVDSLAIPKQIPAMNGAAAQSDSPGAVQVIPAALKAEHARWAVTPKPVLSPPELPQTGKLVEELAPQDLAAGGTASQTQTASFRGLTRNAWMLAGGLFLAIVGGGMLLIRSGLLRPAVIASGDRMLLTVVQNKTGDKALDGTVIEGMEIALRESKSLHVLGAEAYSAGVRQIEAEGRGSAAVMTAQTIAQKVGARAYLYGEIRGVAKGSAGAGSSEAPYTISVEVLQSDSNDKLASLEETAENRDRIPAAIGRLAQALRGELGDGGMRSAIPFEQAATANLDALHAFALGEAAIDAGRTSDAIAKYRTAATLDPQFAQAQIRLAWLYRGEKAEVASSNAAELARKAAFRSFGKPGSAAKDKATQNLRLLAQFCYDINASGDLKDASETIHRYIAANPGGAEGNAGAAQVLRLQGYLPEALLAAQQGYSDHPFHAESYREAELALLGMNRYDGALKLQAKRMGVAGPETLSPAGSSVASSDAVTAGDGLMPGTRNRVAPALSEQGVVSTSEVWTYAHWTEHGLYLDTTGRMAEGLEVWNAAAASASRTPEFASAQAYMLARGALDRALTERCTIALKMVDEVKNLPRGPVASFNAGMAAALCGDQTFAKKTIAALQKEFPQSTAVVHSYVPALEAAAYLGVNEPATTLQALESSRGPEQTWLTPYLRGLAHKALGQMPLAVLDFQTVLAHRGMTLLMESNVYPLAQIEAARAYAATGDKADSIIAYRRFLASWDGADRSQPRIREALARSK